MQAKTTTKQTMHRSWQTPLDPLILLSACLYDVCLADHACWV